MTGRDDLFAVTLAPEEVKRAFRQIAIQAIKAMSCIARRGETAIPADDFDPPNAQSRNQAAGLSGLVSFLRQPAKRERSPIIQRLRSGREPQGAPVSVNRFDAAGARV
jgi:hypothetical protein